MLLFTLGRLRLEPVNCQLSKPSRLDPQHPRTQTHPFLQSFALCQGTVLAALDGPPTARLVIGRMFSLQALGVSKVKRSSLGPKALQGHTGYTVGIWGVPKIRSTILGVPILRTIIFGGVYWAPYLEKLPYKDPRMKGPC